MKFGPFTVAPRTLSDSGPPVPCGWPIVRGALQGEPRTASTGAMVSALMPSPEKVAERLGVTEHFEAIFDIAAAELVPKPEPASYQRFVRQFAIEPTRAAMFEDLARNLLAPKALGMRTVLVVPPGTREVFHEEWEFEGRHDDHVDFVTDDLARFVGTIAEAVAG